jgi:hypothetical protein
MNPQTYSELLFMKLIFRTSLLLLLFLFSLPFPGSSDINISAKERPAAGSTAPVGQVWEGYVSSQKEEFIKVVTTREEWDELWKRAFDKPAPDVDFEKNSAACIFLGYSARWMYGIHMGGPVRKGDKWIIEYGLIEMRLRLSGPFKAGGQYYMKIIERKNEPVVLRGSVVR